MGKKLSNLILGGFLIFIGGLWLLANIIPGVNISWGIMWPVFLMLPGLGFWLGWIFSDNKEKNYGLIIPGTILVCLATLFFVNMFFTLVLHYGTIWAWTSFGYTGSVAAALWAGWLVSNRNTKELKDLKTGAIVLTVISVSIWAVMTFTLTISSVMPWRYIGRLWPCGIITIGLLVLFGPWLRRRKILGKTEAEWEEWGEDLGKSIENAVDGKKSSKGHKSRKKSRKSKRKSTKS